MIPKIIHQTYKTADLPWFFKKGQDSVKEHFPEWEYRFWTDVDLHAFVYENYPQYMEKWLSLDRQIKRVDLWRLLVLHKHGGLYCDLDVQWRRNPEDYLSGNFITYESTQARVKKWEFAGNAVMASEAGNPMLLDAVDWMLGLKPELDPSFHTGPRALGIFLTLHPQYPISIWGPELVDNSRCADGIREAILAVHHRYGTWHIRSKNP